MKIKSLFLLAVILTAALPLTSFGQKEAGQTDDPLTTVKAFYTFHFRHNFDFSVPGLKLRHKWLDESLYKLLMATMNKPDNGDATTLDVDPVPRSQVGEAKMGGNGGSVTVRLFWKDKGKVVDQRKVEVQLTHVANAWKITNIISGDTEDDNLVKLLKHSK